MPWKSRMQRIAYVTYCLPARVIYYGWRRCCSLSDEDIMARQITEAVNNYDVIYYVATLYRVVSNIDCSVT